MQVPYGAQVGSAQSAAAPFYSQKLLVGSIFLFKKDKDFVQYA
jgi:hypothetical protein